MIRLGDIAKVKGGKRLPKGASFSEVPTRFPYIRVVDFRDGSIAVNGLKFLTPEVQNRIRQYTISKEDVYISIAGTIGIVGTIPEKLDGANLTENAAKLVLTEHSSLDKDFLALYLSSETGQNEIANLTTKTTQPKLALNKIEQILIPRPPIEHQRVIVRALKTIKRAREARKRELVLERERKATLMESLFVFGAGSNKEEPSVPMKVKQLQLAPLSELGEIVTGRTPPTEVKMYYGESFMFIGPGDMGESRYVKLTAKYLSEEGLKVSRILPKNTVLVVCIGATIGKVAMTMVEQSATNQQINAIIPNDCVLPEYLYYAMLFRSNAVHRWREANGGLLHTSIRATGWMFGALFFSYVAEFLMLFLVRGAASGRALLPFFTYSPLALVWAWRRLHG